MPSKVSNCVKVYLTLAISTSLADKKIMMKNKGNEFRCVIFSLHFIVWFQNYN